MWRLVSQWRASLVVAAASFVAMALSATAAWAGPGYQLDSSQPAIALSGEVPVGVAVDQGTQVIYVAEASKDLLDVKPGQIEQLSSSGAPTASSPFVTGGQDFFVSVAVNPVTHGIYAYQIEGSTPQGPKGTAKLSTFSSTGTLGTSFSPGNARAGTLAADSSGRLYFPNDTVGGVQVFSSTGALEGTITCSGCPGGAFTTPQAVAFDSAGKLYVVDGAAGGRVVKLSSGGAYESTLPSSEGAVAVAVDTSSNDVFVGTLTGGTYHVVAYDSSGVEFDDFGAGLATTKEPIDLVAGQLAANSTTHRVYLSDPGGGTLRVFERVASIPAPTAAISAPNPVGQVEATLRASVNPKGHVLTGCAFEYTDHADFLANGFDEALTAPCPALVGSDGATVLSANVTGLSASTSYDYRIKVGSHGGQAESSSQSFQTLPAAAPVVTTGAASSLTKSSATLAGSVNPKGGTISSCSFQYVTEAGFQSGGFSGATSKPCAPVPTGNVVNAVSAKATGLAGATTYRFRVLATNNTGTAQGSPVSFTTVAETCAENPALCPSETPQGSPPLPSETSPLPAPIVKPKPKPLKCRKGFKKKKVRGKLKCVRVKKRRKR